MPTGRMKRGAVVLLGAVLGGCPVDQGGATKANDTAADAGSSQSCTPAPVTQLPVIHINWQAKVLKPGTEDVAGTIDAGSVIGGQALRSINEKALPNKPTHKRMVQLTIDPITLSDGSSADSAALQGWYAKTAAVVAQCPEDQQDAGACDPQELWESAGLQRDVELSAATDDGQVLATWRFSGSYVTEVAASSTGTALATVRLVPDTASFASLDLGKLPGDYPVAEAKLTKADAGYTEDDINAFMAGYQSPGEWLTGLNRGAAGTAIYAEASAARCEGEAATKLDVCPASATTKVRTPGDYLPAHNFKVELDGATAGAFEAVAGLGEALEVINYNNDDDAITHKRPGKPKYMNITLRAGQGSGPALYTWYKSTVDGKVTRKSGSIIVVDREGRESVRYNFFDAAPSLWRSSSRDPVSGGFTADEVQLSIGKLEQGTP